MKFIFKIKDTYIEKEYNDSITILTIKKELIMEYYKDVCKYLDFELVLERPIKHFGKLSLEPGVMPSSMDKFKLNKFSIHGIQKIEINVIENYENNILDIIDNIPTNIYDKINKKINNMNNIEVKPLEKFVYKEEDFPTLGS